MGHRHTDDDVFMMIILIELTRNPLCLSLFKPFSKSLAALLLLDESIELDAVNLCLVKATQDVYCPVSAL